MHLLLKQITENNDSLLESNIATATDHAGNKEKVLVLSPRHGSDIVLSKEELKEAIVLLEQEN